jgi:hypothetical protein
VMNVVSRLSSNGFERITSVKGWQDIPRSGRLKQVAALLLVFVACSPITSTAGAQQRLCPLSPRDPGLERIFNNLLVPEDLLADPAAEFLVVVLGESVPEGLSPTSSFEIRSPRSDAGLLEAYGEAQLDRSIHIDGGPAQLIYLYMRVADDPSRWDPLDDVPGAVLAGAGTARSMVVEGPPFGERSRWMGDAPVGLAAALGIHDRSVDFDLANVRMTVSLTGPDPVDQNDVLAMARIVEARLQTALAQAC